MNYRPLILSILFAGWLTPAAAEQVELSEQDIQKLFPQIVLSGDGAKQRFEAAGIVYHERNNARRKGRWETKNGQYCSAWPPNWNEQCYTVWREDDVLTFIGPDGRRVERKMVGAPNQTAASYLTSKQMALLFPKIIAKASNGAVQTFDASGDTKYVYPGGATSVGRWRIDAGKYCSKWPSGESCFRVIREGDTLTFVSSSGQRTRYTIRQR